MCAVIPVYRSTHQCGERSNAAFRTQSAAVLPSLAPHDSKARLQDVTICRRFVAKPRTPHPIPQAAQLFKYRSANVRGRGARPLVLSLGGLRGILSFEKESIPLYPCSAKRCSPRGTSAAASFALVRKREKRKQKAPAGIGEGFLLCCVCIFRREKITSGGVPLCKY